MKSASLIADALRQLPDFDVLETYLEKDFETLIDTMFIQPLASSNQELESSQSSAPISQPPLSRTQEQTLLMAGRRAINKIRSTGTETDLDSEEAEGLEAIILVVGRPTICILNGSFLLPPCGWEVLEQARFSIEKTCRSVGRIELSGHDTLDWVGTSFLVAENVVMTNRYVAEIFCQMRAYEQWAFMPYVTSYIEYVREVESHGVAPFIFTDVIGIHDTCDLALLKVSPFSEQGHLAPLPLILSAKQPQNVEDRDVYIIGHPAWDGRQDDPGIVARIFAGVHGVKRLQPGKVLAAFEHEHLLTHDCSTLTGNSGSCIVDIESNHVLGLHVSGRPRQINRGIPLWTLRSDPLLRKARVWFE